MKANYLPIQSVFSKHTVFEIPYYQRSYVWKEENWSRFLEDMESVTAINKQYFIGSLILKQKGTVTGSKYGDVRVVIDGQQRLTTITIFFNVLSFLKGRDKIFDSFMINLSDETDEQEVAIHHNHIDAAAFNKVVELKTLEELSAKNEKGEVITQSKIIDLYNFFRTHINVEKVNSDIIKRCVHFVAIDLDSDENEQQIFDTINSLGVKLTTSELLKNYLFDQYNEAKYNKYWKPIFETDTEQKAYWDQDVTSGTKRYHLIDLFLYAFLMIKMRAGDYGVTTEDKLDYEKVDHLFASYKEFVDKYMGGDKDALMREIYDSATIFKSNFNPSCKQEAIALEPGFERINLMMFALDFTVMIPYVLYVLLKAEKEDQIKIYAYLETFMMRRTIAKLETRGYNGLFNDALITNKVLTVDALRIYVDKDKDVTYRAANPKQMWYSINNAYYINRQALGFLYMLESRLRSEKKSATQLYGIGNYSLEHLLPKKWKETWQLPENPLVVNETNNALYTFGNLAIIPGALNTSISNAPWQIKLHGKGNKDGLLKYATGLVTLDDYLSLDEWNLQCIRKRAKDLFEKILHVWSEPWDVEFTVEEEFVGTVS